MYDPHRPSRRSENRTAAQRAEETQGFRQKAPTLRDETWVICQAQPGDNGLDDCVGLQYLHLALDRRRIARAFVPSLRLQGTNLWSLAVEHRLSREARCCS